MYTYVYVISMYIFTQLTIVDLFVAKTNFQKDFSVQLTSFSQSIIKKKNKKKIDALKFWTHACVCVYEHIIGVAVECNRRITSIIICPGTLPKLESSRDLPRAENKSFRLGYFTRNNNNNLIYTYTQTRRYVSPYRNKPRYIRGVIVPSKQKSSNCDENLLI